MLAARLHGNRDLRVETVDDPGAPGPGEIRVAPRWCGICGTDLHEYAHGPLYVPQENLPQVLGHEFSAEVLETGREVDSLRAGDRVAVLPHVFCGRCYFCVRGRQGLCTSLRLTGVSWPWGGLAEQAVVPASQCVPLPDGVSYEQAAIVEPLGSVAHAVERAMRPGDRVLITGAGPIGQLGILAAAAAGAAAIYVSEPNDARRAQAAGLGVTNAFDPRHDDVAGELRDATGGLGVDCSIECSGAQAGLDLCVDATRPAGYVAQIAIHVGPRTVVPETWTWKDLTIGGIWSFKIYDIPRILGQIGAGRLPVERIVTSRIGIRDLVSEGIERLADPAGDQVKILVSPSGDGPAAGAEAMAAATGSAP
jgi:(R,R)-butanediol dehydrogenase / meso-butanediol dehydrogenase / diacetyl reductase